MRALCDVYNCARVEGCMHYVNCIEKKLVSKPNCDILKYSTSSQCSIAVIAENAYGCLPEVEKPALICWIQATVPQDARKEE